MEQEGRMSDKTETERLIAIIEKLVDENATLAAELSRRTIQSSGTTVPWITWRPNDPIKPPYTVTCGVGDAE